MALGLKITFCCFCIKIHIAYGFIRCKQISSFLNFTNYRMYFLVAAAAVFDLPELQQTVDSFVAPT